MNYTVRDLLISEIEKTEHYLTGKVSKDKKIKVLRYLHDLNATLLRISL